MKENATKRGFDLISKYNKKEISQEDFISDFKKVIDDDLKISLYLINIPSIPVAIFSVLFLYALEKNPEKTLQSAILKELHTFHEKKILQISESIIAYNPIFFITNIFPTLNISPEKKKYLYIQCFKQTIDFIDPHEFVESFGMVPPHELQRTPGEYSNEKIGRVLEGGICFGTTLSIIESGLENFNINEKRARFLQAKHMMAVFFRNTTPSDIFYKQFGHLVLDMNAVSVLIEFKTLYPNSTDKFPLKELGKIACRFLLQDEVPDDLKKLQELLTADKVKKILAPLSSSDKKENSIFDMSDKVKISFTSNLYINEGSFFHTSKS